MKKQALWCEAKAVLLCHYVLSVVLPSLFHLWVRLSSGQLYT